MVLLLFTALGACTQTGPSEHYAEVSLDQVWLQGKAEVATYELSQNRYEAVHPGKAVVITVSEPFSPGKNVKKDDPSTQSTTVLKTNQIRRFTTGIYDYSIFTSAFVQADGYLEKITSSSQDWCGQGWLQMIGGSDGMDLEQRSYFEAEGDRTAAVKTTLSEDALFNLIRIDPDLVPAGEVDMLPAAHIIHMRHLPLRAYAVDITKAADQDTSRVTVSWPDLDRRLTIRYATAAPHTIYGWRDRYPSAFDKQPRETEATLIGSTWTAYWSLNGVADTTYRQPLGLD